MVKFSNEFKMAREDTINFIAPPELDPVGRGILKGAGVVISPLLFIIFGLKYVELRKLKKKENASERRPLLD